MAWPGGGNRPNASNLNLVPGQTSANAVAAGTNYEPAVRDYVVNFANSAGYVGLVFDVFGYFVPTQPPAE